MEQTEGWYNDPEQPGMVRWWTGSEWTDDRRVAGGNPVTSVAPVAPVAQTGYPMQYQIPGAEKKVPAGILGILLGSWGIHRFYLSDVQGGLLRILITVLTCGIGGIIGFIEGIIYLTKSDADFVQIYLVEKKEWF